MSAAERGIVIGIDADRKGRKAALQLIIGLMTLSMAVIALAPPYAAIMVGQSLAALGGAVAGA